AAAATGGSPPPWWPAAAAAEQPPAARRRRAPPARRPDRPRAGPARAPRAPARTANWRPAPLHPTTRTPPESRLGCGGGPGGDEHTGANRTAGTLAGTADTTTTSR